MNSGGKSDKQWFLEALDKRSLMHLGKQKNLELYNNEQFIRDSIFIDINGESESLMSLTGIPGESGFHVRINSIKVTPSHYASYKKMPKLARMAAKLLGAQEAGK